jgi:para-nitrobenzyl esterase
MTRRVLPLVPILAMLTLGGCGPSSEDRDAAADRIPERSARRTTTGGEVVGFVGRYGSLAWLGIPFAKAPAGDLRWRAPQPADPWTGTLEALEFGSSCVQYASTIGGVVDAEPGDLVGDEDCLYLNVYTPRFADERVPSGSARLPVMFWIHGGGNRTGTASFYDGGNLATTGNVVVVTTNYRLGPFGWFRHTALTGDGTSAADRSGNYGTLDLVRGLDWVRENISAFGGDPGNVTIFGESAGGLNVLTLMLSPGAEGLFHRAILQSPGMGSASLAEAENYADASDPGDRFSSREAVLRLLEQDGTASGRVAAREAAAAKSPADLARYLRGKDRSEIMAAYSDDRGIVMVSLPTVIRDGHVLPEDEPMQVLARGGHNRTPVIFGSNRDEQKLFMFRDPQEIRSVFGLFPWLRDEQSYNVRADYRARMWKAGGVDEPAALLRDVQGPSVYAYRWDWDEEPKVLWTDLSVMLGAAHGLEIPFVFGHFELGEGGNIIFTDANASGRRALSAAMISYWTEFAQDGVPGGGRDGDLPRWTAWDNSGPTSDRFIIFDTDAGGGIRMSSDYLTRARVAAQLNGDPRFRNADEKCELVAQLESWWGEFDEEQQVATRCRDFRAVAAPAAGD